MLNHLKDSLIILIEQKSLHSSLFFWLLISTTIVDEIYPSVKRVGLSMLKSNNFWVPFPASFDQCCGSVFIFTDPDPDPELDVGGQYGSRALMTKN